MKGKWLLAVGIVAILGVAGAALWTVRPTQPDSPVPSPAAVSTSPPKSELDLSGRVQAVKLVRVPAPLEGVLENLQVREGEEVSEGQLLATIKSDALNTDQERAASEVENAQGKITNLEAQLIAARLEAQRTRSDAESSRATLESARKASERQSMLWKEGATARKNFERAESEFKNATIESAAKDNLARQADDRVQVLTRSLEDARRTLADKTKEWEEAKAELNAAQVHAPVSGVIVRVTKQSGDPVDRQVVDLFHIAADLTLMEAVVSLNPEELKLVKPGLLAQVRLIEAGNEPIPAQLREIKENEAFFEFKSPTDAVTPGLIAQVKILLNPPEPKK